MLGGKNLTFHSYSERISWLYSVPSEVMVTAHQYKVVLNGHFYPAMQHFCPDHSGLCLDDTILHPQGLRWFDEDKNDVNCAL